MQTAAATTTTSTPLSPSTSGGADGQPTPSTSSTPCNDSEIIDGANGRQYIISCASDTSGTGAYRTETFPTGDFTQCITVCDQDTQCGAWVWGGSGGPGQTGGICFLKQAPQSPVSGIGNLVAGILVGSEGPSQVPSSTASSTTQDSGASSSSATSTQLPDPDPCPGVNGTSFSDSEGIRYTIYCGIDTQPTSFNSDAFPTFRGCIEACRQQPQFCGAVGYIGGRCYFKPPPEIFSEQGGVQLAVRAPDDGLSTSSSVLPASSSTLELPSDVSVSTTEIITST